jgi:hypothetical protein
MEDVSLVLGAYLVHNNESCYYCHCCCHRRCYVMLIVPWGRQVWKSSTQCSSQTHTPELSAPLWGLDSSPSLCLMSRAQSFCPVCQDHPQGLALMVQETSSPRLGWGQWAEPRPGLRNPWLPPRAGPTSKPISEGWGLEINARLKKAWSPQATGRGNRQATTEGRP